MDGLYIHTTITAAANRRYKEYRFNIIMSEPKPTIYQFSLGDKSLQSFVRPGGIDSFLRILKKLQEVAIVQEAWSSQEALDLLEQDKAPKAIFITDPGITDPENKEVSTQVVEYVRNGGTAILGLGFSSNVKPADFQEYMSEQWDLPWKLHSYNREDWAINITASGPPSSQWMHGLQALYRERCVNIDKVAPIARWYTLAPDPYDPDDYENEDEWRAATAKMAPKTQTPVAFASVGKGRLGYTGDVNQHESTDAVILAMLGLNYWAKWCTCGGEKPE